MKKHWKTQLYTHSEKSHRNLRLPSFSQNTAYYSTSMPWTVHSKKHWASCWWNCAKQWPMHKWTLQTGQPQSSPRSPCHSASLPFHTHCSSFWNLETVQLCVTKAGKWSLKPGTQPEGRHSVWQSSLYTADRAYRGENPHGASPSWFALI